MPAPRELLGHQDRKERKDRRELLERVLLLPVLRWVM
jgi:hypothetical protein